MVCFDRRTKGKQAEQDALSFLTTRGLSLITKNYTNKSGEIDLIMQDQNDIVFVEVRYRSTDRYGSAIETVDVVKQRKLIKTAHYFLYEKRLTNKVNCRFDVIAIDGSKFDWIKNAFEDGLNE